ncbi:MAG TPA: AMP-binding protein [Xanthobacteraceae bacterium]|jgi:acyl-coenzyme A synthetase/AMP-(fatty) acid ligase|nr:AMP-binding protein [Xanthobacteraceae bacterium]
MNYWFDHILYNTRSQPESTALVMEDRVVTYRMLGIAIENSARRIASLKILKEAPVAICVANPIRNLALCLALYQIGMCSISLDYGQLGISNLKFAAILGDGEAKSRVDSSSQFIEVMDDWFALDAAPGDLPPDGFCDPGEICRYALTSGSTGAQKTFGCTIEYVGRHVPRAIIYNCTHVLCMLGLSSAWGYLIACATLATGKTLCFATTPFQAVRMIETFSIDYFMASIDQLVAITRVARKQSAKLGSLRTVVAGGSVPSRALLEAAAAHVCKDLICRYGTTELGLVADAPATEVLENPGLIGRVIPDIELAVFDQRGNRLSSGKVGIVKGRIKSWIGALAAERENQHPWIDVGDVGWVTSDNRFFVVGRTADIMTSSIDDATAQQVSPVYEVEHLVKLEWDATDAAAVLIGDGSRQPEIWVGAVDCKDADAAKLETILRRRGIEGAVRLFSLPSIPRAANGKIQHAQLKSQLLNIASISNPGSESLQIK